MSVRAVVDEHIAAFNAHDTGRLLAGLAPDAVWVTGVDAVTGRAAPADLFDEWLWSMDPSLTALSIVVDGERAAAQLREALTVDGRRREFDIAAFFEVADGLIRRAKIYREGSADV